jgi:hypothetical protein
MMEKEILPGLALGKTVVLRKVGRKKMPMAAPPVVQVGQVARAPALAKESPLGLNGIGNSH